jgi:hypothetical protein
MTGMEDVTEELAENTRGEFFGRRKPVLSKSGMLLYQSNDTATARVWSFLERTLLPVRARDIVLNRFPAKDIWDALSLGQLFLRPDFDFRQKLNCLGFYFDGGKIDNVCATLSRSGYGWYSLAIALAMDLAAGGKGDYAYIDNWWHPSGGVRYTKLDWRVPAGTMNDDLLGLITEPVLYHTHHPYYRLRCRKVKNMNVVVVVRSILESLEGNFFKVGNSSFWPEVTLDDEDSFNWDRYLDDDIEFYNSWGDVATWHPRCLIVRYHELKADQVGTLKAMTDFWKLDIPLECLEEALKRTSKKAMADKVPKDEHATNSRVSYRKERGVISESRKKHILGRLQRELIHDLGYDYSDSHEWGHVYE